MSPRILGRIKSLAVCAALLGVMLALTACGAEGATLTCKTVIANDGSGSRSLIISVPNGSLSEDEMTSVRSGIEDAVPSGGEFTDLSDSSTYKYEVTYEFSDAAGFSQLASDFGSSANLSVTGGAFSPVWEMSESYLPESWFSWALDASGRSTSDIEDCRYELEMPGYISYVSDGFEWMSSSEYSGTTASATTGYSTSSDIAITAANPHSLAWITYETDLAGGPKIDRKITIAVTQDTADAIKVESGEGAARTQLESSLDGWKVEESSSNGEVLFTCTRTLTSLDDYSTSVTEQFGGEAWTDSAPYNYFQPHYSLSETFDPLDWISADLGLDGDVTYRIKTTWAVDSVWMGGEEVKPVAGAYEWKTGDMPIDVSIEAYTHDQPKLIVGFIVAALLALLGIGMVFVGVVWGIPGVRRPQAEATPAMETLPID